MPRTTIRRGSDAWVNSAKSAANYGGDGRLRVAQSTKRGLLFIPNPVDAEQTVQEGTLYLTQRGDLTGEVTITVSPLADRFRENGVTWDNQPDNVPAEGVSVTMTDPVGGTVWEFDVTDHFQDSAIAQEWYGWRIASDNTDTIEFASFSADSGQPRAFVHYNDAPSTPDDLSPSTGYVSVPLPVLRWSYVDPDSDISMLRVQIAGEPTFASPLFDTDWTPTTDPELDLAETAFVGLADGDDLLWRVRVEDEAGIRSEWSDAARLARKVKGALTILSPSGGVVTEFTPPILWSFAGTQKAFRVRVRRANQAAREVFDSGWTKGTDTSLTIPKGVLKPDLTYIVRVSVRDDEDREATPGDPISTSTEATFYVDDDLATPGTDTLTAEPMLEGPGVVLNWTRSEAPDSWTIRRDGEVIETDLDPVEVATETPGTYTWTDLTAPGLTNLTYRVVPVVNGKAAKNNASATTQAQGGAWLIDPTNGLYVLLREFDTSPSAGEQRETVTPLGADRPVHRVFGVRGLEGSATATLKVAESSSVLGPGFNEQVSAIRSMQERPLHRYGLRWGRRYIPVHLGALTLYGAKDSNQVRRADSVRFQYWQAGGLEIDPDI